MLIINNKKKRGMGVDNTNTSINNDYKSSPFNKNKTKNKFKSSVTEDLEIIPLPFKMKHELNETSLNFLNQF